MRSSIYLIAIILSILWSSCSDDRPVPVDSPLFKIVDASHSKLSFANDVQESDTLNYYNFPYIYEGGGVAISDFNNDGLSDIFVTGNMVANKLYLNKGDLVFEDITAESGLQGDNRWYTGVTVVDINYDGHLDLYLSVSGKEAGTKNQLFVNQGDLTFVEKARDYGIDDDGNSIQSSFFDYDRDGDLDLFVANYPSIPLTQGNLYYATMMKKNAPEHSGHLYRNDDGHFSDVTLVANVQNFGLTLGLSSADLNNDGWPDLYLSNDFNVPDYFYLNNGDGTFREVLKQAVGHISMFGMGIDAADFTNDGLPDLVQADMVPEDHQREKINMGRMNPRIFWEAVDLGFHYQYMQNSLQLNHGVQKDGIPIMGEISRMAGVATTDWSWSTLFADLDNDGWKDLYITNGIKRDVNDRDIGNRNFATTFKAAFERPEMEEYPSVPLDNYAFKNNGDLTFKKITKEWGLDDKGFSNGMAYGDLDNDGDLDLVINNLDQKMSLFENRADATDKHFLRVKLEGSEKNLNGIGAKLTLKDKNSDKLQTFEMNPTRGFQSYMEPIAHFGLKDSLGALTLSVDWPDGKGEMLEVGDIDRTITVRYTNATDAKEPPENTRGTNLVDITKDSGIDFVHEEDPYDDYRIEPLLPHKYSTIGPGLAVADINVDGLDDFYVGNATGQKSAVYVQQSDKTFRLLDGPWQDDYQNEDTGALFFDADADGDIDLYVVSGGNDPLKDDLYYQDRLYLNTPIGFVKTENALSTIKTAGKVVTTVDYDNDGDLDLFVGGRNVPAKYPSTPESYLLKNNGETGQKLRFENVTDKLAPGLKETGMVTSAVWTDLNGDGWTDLVVTGEWMPIKILINEQGTLVERTEHFRLGEKTGWWYGLSAFDVDNDGDQDLIAGNLGLNYKYRASIENPFEVFAWDFDENGLTDIVLGQHKEGKLLPVRGRDCSTEQIPAVQKIFPTYREFASADIYDIYGKAELEKALHFSATTFSHYWLENVGTQGFKWHKLPNRSQLSPIHSIIPFDYNQDGYTDMLLSGSLYDAEVETPRADAGVGLVLINKNGKGFEAVNPSESGLMVIGNTQNSQPINLGKDKGFLFVGSDEPVKLIRFNDIP